MARIFKALGPIAVIVTISSAALAECPQCSSNAQGPKQCCPWDRPYTEDSSADLFYNFYQPGNGGRPAAAFPAPYPTPAYVGHQYTTYQPFMPNEWLYKHHRTYHQHYNNGMGMTRTTVKWKGAPIHRAILGARTFVSLPR